MIQKSLKMAKKSVKKIFSGVARDLPVILDQNKKNFLYQTWSCATHGKRRIMKFENRLLVKHLNVGVWFIKSCFLKFQLVQLLIDYTPDILIH